MSHWAEQLFKEDSELFTQFFDQKFEDAVDDVRGLLTLLEQEYGRGPATILDAPCGNGRHVLAFASEGREATGIDFSETFIEKARARADLRGVANRTTFEVQDLRELDEWTGSYDLITNFWTSLGYYDRETDVRILSQLRHLLSDSGMIAVEMSNKEYLLQNYTESTVQETGNMLQVERKSFDLETGRFHTFVDVFSETGEGYEYQDRLEFSPRIYAPVELRDLLSEAGFEHIDLYGGFNGEDLTMDSERVVVLAE